MPIDHADRRMPYAGGYVNFKLQVLTYQIAMKIQ